MQHTATLTRKHFSIVVCVKRTDSTTAHINVQVVTQVCHITRQCWASGLFMIVTWFNTTSCAGHNEVITSQMHTRKTGQSCFCCWVQTTLLLDSSLHPHQTLFMSSNILCCICSITCIISLQVWSKHVPQITQALLRQLLNILVLISGSLSVHLAATFN